MRLERMAVGLRSAILNTGSLYDIFLIKLRITG